MAQTPEGRVKDAIKRILRAEGCWFHMPVQNGMGTPTVDFHGARRIDGRAFLIEAKAPGEKPTPRQRKTLGEAMGANVTVFVLDGDAHDLLAFHAWLRHPHTPNAFDAEHMIHKWNIDKVRVLCE